MFYKITLTSSGGLSTNEIEFIKNYFEHACVHVFLVEEFGESGTNRHVEGIVEFDTDVTSNVTKRVRGLYERMGIDEVKGISFKVQRATHLIGAFIYASKELKEKGNCLVLKGWEQTWIDKQIKDNVKAIPHKMLKKHGVRVTQGTGAGLMFEYCQAHGYSCMRKHEYLAIVREMGDAGYMFGCIRHMGLYQDLCALFGDGTAAVKCAESELRFLDD